MLAWGERGYKLTGSRVSRWMMGCGGWVNGPDLRKVKNTWNTLKIHQKKIVKEGYLKVLPQHY